MTGHRKALIIAIDDYDHPGLSGLRSPSADAEALGAVLGDSRIGDFEVDVVRNEPAHEITRRIEDLFCEAKGDDVVLLHFSGHGLKGEAGDLFFAARDTLPNRLASTAVAADFVQRCIRTSPSRRIVLLLDCCYGGAFSQGVAVRASGDVHVLDSFPFDRLGGGRSRAVISASNAMEYAFESGQLTDDGRPTPSLFTSALVNGLSTGEADRDEDGFVSVSELYDYVFDRVREQNPNQTPTRNIEMQGELYLAKSGRRRLRPGPLPPDLQAAIEDSNPYSRVGAIAELRSRLLSENLPVAAGAREALLNVAASDIQFVANAAKAALSELVLRVEPSVLDFGSVEVNAMAPARRIELAGPPLARHVIVQAAEPWIRVREGDAAYELSVSPQAAGMTSGTVTFVSAAAGDFVLDVRVDGIAASQDDAGDNASDPVEEGEQPDTTEPRRPGDAERVLHEPGRRWPCWFYAVDPSSIRDVPTVWPSATDYVDAIQAADHALWATDLRDAVLVRDAFDMPAPSSGQNAVVFELSHGSGELALRCFTRSPKDAAMRYRALAPLLEAAGCDVIVPARWVDDAIRVGDRSLPAVVMPWIAGIPLNSAVESMLDRPQDLVELAQTWLAALTEMADAGLSHGDLQCGNVLIDDYGAVNLVDLDGFYLPSMAKSPAEFGHADFQHPRRTARDWGPDMDAFSGLVIFLGLRATAADPTLWSFHSGENLILGRDDYRCPGEAPIWAQLRQNSDPVVRRLVQLLAQYCAEETPPTMNEVLHNLRDEPGTLDNHPEEATELDPIRKPLDQPESATNTDANTAIVPLSEVPRLSQRIGSWFGQNSIVTGLTAGLICALLIIGIFAAIGSTAPAVVRAPLLVALAGSLLTAGLAGIPRFTMGAWRSGAKRALGGAAFGAILSLASLGVFEIFARRSFAAGPAPVFAVVTAWTVCALSIGISSGIVRRSGRAVISGLIGGVAGGVLGGFIHWTSGPNFVGDETINLELDVLAPATAIAIGLACAAIGLSIGLVDRVRRRCWLTVIEGSLRGREVILDRPETTIGTADSATLRLAGNSGSEPTHAMVLGHGSGFTLRCHGRVEVNGDVWTSADPRPLNDGDVLRIGGSFIRFDHRDG